MKIYKILSHPYTLLISYPMILISGEHTGGFYALYLLTGLPFGIAHALLGTAGMIVLLLNYNLSSTGRVVKQSVNVIALGLLVLSLLLFFKNDTKHYNWDTFEQGLPIFTLLFAAFIAVCFLFGTFWNPPLKNEPTRNALSKV